MLNEVISKCQRNYNLEKKTINQMAYVLGNIITKEEIYDRLEKNGFSGLYIVPKTLYDLIGMVEGVEAFYSVTEKIIVINEEYYLKNPSVCIHEICHAYLNDEILRKVTIDNLKVFYGRGLEEGLASIVQNIKKHTYIDTARPLAYAFQARFFQQLNELYKYTQIQEYQDLLIHVFKKPSEFLILVRNIYYDILKNNIDCFDKIVPDRSAQRIVTVADFYTESDTINRKLYDLINCMNSLYLTMSDSSIYTGTKSNDLFNIPDVYKCSSDIYVLYSLIGKEDF